MVENEVKTCVVCGESISRERKRKDTCSDTCGFRKMAAWDAYLQKYRKEIMKAAIRAFP